MIKSITLILTKDEDNVNNVNTKQTVNTVQRWRRTPTLSSIMSSSSSARNLSCARGSLLVCILDKIDTNAFLPPSSNSSFLKSAGGLGVTQRSNDQVGQNWVNSPVTINFPAKLQEREVISVCLSLCLSVSVSLSLSVSLSPDVILCGWLGLKHQLTN